MSDFGTRMKRAREERGVTLRQIATATKISVGALEALERNDISRLPGGIFSRAFVRSYATEIGLDPEETVREFITQFPHDSVTVGSPHVPQEDHAAIESSRRSAETALKLFAVSVPLAGAILYFTLSRPERPAADVANTAANRPAAAETLPADAGQPTSMPPAPAVEPAATEPTSDSRPAPIGAEPLVFELVATAPVSLDVVIDGERREARTLAQGERLVFQADRDMRLTMSDASAVQLTINRQPAVALGAAGEARTVQIGHRNYGAFLASQ